MSKAIIKLSNTRSPKNSHWYRLKAATPNMAAFKMRPIEINGDLDGFSKTNTPCPSFGPMYLIHQSGDMTSLSKGFLERFLDTLRWKGYTEFEFIGDNLEHYNQR